MKEIIEKDRNKLRYTTPAVGIILLEISDIVTASGTGTNDTQTEPETGGGSYPGAWS